ncbi:MAG: hypothetical protein IIY77_00435, partial [Lachnospiraceae bacterium]|nr:hypothetical protein [Lachnospiraceae bacterium]
MRRFGNIDEIRNASEEEIAAIDEFNSRSARQVYIYFHPEEAEISAADTDSSAEKNETADSGAEKNEAADIGPF